MEPDNDIGPTAPAPSPHHRIALQPGQLSKPEKVWASSSALVIGFYQAAPFSEAFKIFYKKSGAVFGTQVMLTPASILGPELAVRQPVLGESQYFEYEIKKLKPSTQYVIKIKTSDDACEVRSDKMCTVSQEEERTRDNDMRNFVGALVKLGDYDGLVVSYTPPSGIFAIRILQIDDVASSLQLARLTSDYTDSGVPVQAYTLSQVRFGRWGGAITGSKVVNEGELKWLVARAVQMSDKSDAASAFEARQRMLQAQVEKVTVGLEVEWSNRFRGLRMRSLAYLLLLALVAVAAGVGMWVMLSRAGRRQRELEAKLAAGGVRQTELEAQLQLLHLYRVSLELDVERRVALSDARLLVTNSSSSKGAFQAAVSSSKGGSSAHGPIGALGSRNATADGGGGDLSTGSSAGGGSSARRREASRRRGSDGGRSGVGRDEGRAAPRAADPRVDRLSSRGGRRPSDERKQGRATGSSDDGGGGGGSRGGGARKGRSRGGDAAERADSAAGEGADGDYTGARKLWGLPHQALRLALARSQYGRVPPETRREGSEWESGPSYGDAADVDEQPDAWTFIHYVSHVYAMHLQEWMKVQLQKNVRRKVNDMLLPAAAGGANLTARGGGASDSDASARGDEDDDGAEADEWCSRDGHDEYGEECAGVGEYDREYDNS